LPRRVWNGIFAARCPNLLEAANSPEPRHHFNLGASGVANTLLPYIERENDMPDSIYDVITLIGTSNVS
jgi:hypothetical protein